MSELKLRLAFVDDITAMHYIRLSVTENKLSDESALRHEDYFPFLGTSGEIWVGEFDREIAGFGAIDLRNSSVWALFVAQEFESHGVGKALLTKLLDRAQSQGMTALHLTTTPGTRAEQFYIRQGWELIGGIPNGEVGLRYT